MRDLAIGRARLKEVCRKVLTATLCLSIVVGSTAIASLVSPQAAQAVDYTCDPRTVYTPTGSGVTRTVNNQTELNSAMTAAQPGDVINLNSGNYTSIDYRGGSYNSGTVANPIVFQAGAGQSPVLTSGTGYTGVGVHTEGKDNLIFSGFEIRNHFDGMVVRNADNVKFEYNEVHELAQAGIVAQAVQTNSSLIVSNITIRCNVVHDTGKVSPQYGEGIYLGNGNNFSGDHDILVEKNEVYAITADGMELKAHTYNITVQDNYFHDINFSATSNGRGLSIATNNENYGNANYLIQRNVFANISSDQDNNAIAILVGHGTTTIRNNLLYNIEDRGIGMQSTGGQYGFGNPSFADVNIYNNTAYGCGGYGCIVDFSGGIANITQTNNLFSDDAGTNDRTATSGDFVGPLTGDADAGSGPGSGYELAPSSAAVDNATTLGSFSDDLDGRSRPAGSAWDYGAYERGASGGGTGASPTDIIISNLVVPQTNQTNDVVGVLGSVDSDSSSFTYSLVAGAGDTNNSSFVLGGSGNEELRLAGPLSAGTYSVRIQSSDSANTYEEALSISYQPYGDPISLINLADGNFITNDPLNGLPNVIDDNLSTRWSREGDGTYLEAELSGGPYAIDHVDMAFYLGTERTANFDVQTSTDGSVFTNVTGGNSVSGNYDSSGDTNGLATFRFDAVSNVTHIRLIGHGNSVSDWNSYTELDVYEQPSTNSAPTAIGLTSSNVDENVSANTVVGSLSTTDADGTDTHTYSLVSGTGDADNASFNINGSNLRITNSPDYEVKNSYSVRVQTDDGNGGTFSDTFTISVNDLNATPTQMQLSNDTIVELQPSGTLVGSLSATDDGEDGTLAFSLVAGTGDADNASFQIDGTDLETAGSLSANTYSVRVNVNDGANNFPAIFTITITATPNSTPTNISLTSSDFDENASANTVVGTLSTTDADGSDTHTYSLVSGAGSTDNASFNISGTNLRFTGSADFETKASYSIRLQTNDGNGGIYQKPFTITVNDLNTTPSDISLTSTSVNENVASNTVIGTLSATDDGEDGTETYSLVAGTGDTDNASFNISGTTLRISNSPDFESQSSYSIRVNVNDGAYDFPKQFTITINDLNAAPTALNIDNTSINDTAATAGASIGTLSTVDDGEDGTLTYGFTTGTGDEDNASFTIGGSSSDELLVGASALTAGTYNVRVSVDDGVNVVSQAYVVTVVDTTSPDTTPPALTLVGLTPVEVTEGDTYTDAGATATDDTDGDITSSINTTNPVNTNTVGTYIIRYNVSDLAGNNAVELTRTVKVVAAPSSSDGDAIDDATEDAAPNGGDFNNDGTADSQQSHVGTIQNPQATSGSTSFNPNAYVSLVGPSGSTISRFNVVSESSLTYQDEEYDYPIGLFDFAISGVAVSSTQTITLFLDQVYDTSNWTWRKYNASSQTYSTITNAIFSTASVGSDTVTTVSYEITDGGENDTDGLTDGILTDPAGPAIEAETLQETGSAATLSIVTGTSILLTTLLVYSTSSGRKRSLKRSY